jgi:hypothetical protein
MFDLGVLENEGLTALYNLGFSLHVWTVGSLSSNSFFSME